jgi:antitoxin component YwqK of YwqJK toxin-antitoxin module
VKNKHLLILLIITLAVIAVLFVRLSMVSRKYQKILGKFSETFVIDTVRYRDYNPETKKEDGPLVSEYTIKYYLDGREVKHGFYREWFSGKMQDTVSDSTSDTLGDTAQKADTAGILHKEGFYKDGEKDSLWVRYYVTGKKREQAFYRNGKVQGRILAWYENGHKSFEGNYKDDILDTLVMWHPEGQIKRKSIFDNLETVAETCWSINGPIVPCEEF